MISVSISVTIALAYFFISGSVIQASPIFSVDGDKSTPIRYTFRVERIEFGNPTSEDSGVFYPDIEDCSEDPETSSEYPTSTEYDSGYHVDYEYSEEEDEEEAISDEDDEEIETSYDDYSIDYEPQEESDEEVDIPEEEEEPSNYYVDYLEEYYDHIDDYSSDEPQKHKDTISSLIGIDIATLRTIKKNHRHGRKPESRQKNLFRGIKTPFPTWAPKVKAKAGRVARPHRIAAERTSPSKRHQQIHRHKPLQVLV